jgi:hypothetical protein
MNYMKDLQILSNPTAKSPDPKYFFEDGTPYYGPVHTVPFFIPDQKSTMYSGLSLSNASRPVFTKQELLIKELEKETENHKRLTISTSNSKGTVSGNRNNTGGGLGGQ